MDVNGENAVGIGGPSTDRQTVRPSHAAVNFVLVPPGLMRPEMQGRRPDFAGLDHADRKSEPRRDR